MRWGAMVQVSGCIAVVLQLLPLCTPAVVGKQQETADVAGEADLDESPQGKLRIQEIEKLAHQLLKERTAVERERRPFAVRLDSMLGEVVQARESAVRTRATVIATERRIAQLDHQINLSFGSEQKELRAQQSRLRTSLNTLTRRITADRKLIDDRMSQIDALNPQISSFNQRLLRLEDEMSECRKQWLGIRQPFEKYSRGDFEGLRRVLDDWLVMDGQWPEAYAWAALCAYELDEISSASMYLEKAQGLSAGLSRSKKLWPQLEALAALIRRKQPGQSFKAEAALTNAIRLTDKNSDWEACFLLGRCYFERPEDGSRAKMHFQRALASQPNCDCAKFWLARLQTTSTLTGVRDLSTGTRCLEQLWDKSGQRSWRIAYFLAEAYSASQRMKDAETMWSRAAELAPVEHKQRVVQKANSTIK